MEGGYSPRDEILFVCFLIFWSVKDKRVSDIYLVLMLPNSRNSGSEGFI